MESARNFADLQNRVIDQAREFVQIPGVGGTFAVQSSGQRLGAKGRAQQMLAEMIVQILSDPPLFAVRGIK